MTINFLELLLILILMNFTCWEYIYLWVAMAIKFLGLFLFLIMNFKSVDSISIYESYDDCIPKPTHGLIMNFNLSMSCYDD